MQILNLPCKVVHRKLWRLQSAQRVVVWSVVAAFGPSPVGKAASGGISHWSASRVDITGVVPCNPHGQQPRCRAIKPLHGLCEFLLVCMRNMLLMQCAVGEASGRLLPEKESSTKQPSGASGTLSQEIQPSLSRQRPYNYTAALG